MVRRRVPSSPCHNPFLTWQGASSCRIYHHHRHIHVWDYHHHVRHYHHDVCDHDIHNSLPTPSPPWPSTIDNDNDRTATLRQHAQSNEGRGEDWALCPSRIVNCLFSDNYVYCTNLLHNIWRHSDMMRRVPSLLIAPDTISNMARRGKTLHVMSNSLLPTSPPLLPLKTSIHARFRG